MSRFTLAIIKPDVMIRPAQVQNGLFDLIRANHFSIIAKKDIQLLPLADAERFYADHRGKFFYQRLISSITRYCRYYVVLLL